MTETKLHKVFDEEAIQALTLKTLLEIKNSLKEYGIKLNDKDVDRIIKTCNNVFEWYKDEIPF